MLHFLDTLKTRNESLFYFGLICLTFSLICLILSKTTDVQVNNTSAWIKPFKFAISTFFFAWAMGWYCYYLPNFNINMFNLAVIILLGLYYSFVTVTN
jgi:hypothetical protein